MRRPTLIVLLVLFVILVGAGIAQLVIASGPAVPLQGPTSPGQLPGHSPAATP